MAFFKEHFENENFKVIAAAGHLNTVYLVCAAKSSQWKNIAAIVLCRYVKEDYNFFYKDQGEDQGLPESRCFCPERILKQLAPVEETYSDSSSQRRAREWRDACWANINKRSAIPNLQAGDVVKGPKVLKFTNGFETDTLRVTKTKPLRFQVSDDSIMFFRVRRKDLDGISVLPTGCLA
ncbi:MAG: hypothetical protein HY741_15850 [Chloroflexi bacterium]|nr:hypothetical protein [Chloroflexota bacterium]